MAHDLDPETPIRLQKFLSKRSTRSAGHTGNEADGKRASQTRPTGWCSEKVSCAVRHPPR